MQYESCCKQFKSCGAPIYPKPHPKPQTQSQPLNIVKPEPSNPQPKMPSPKALHVPPPSKCLVLAGETYSSAREVLKSVREITQPLLYGLKIIVSLRGMGPSGLSTGESYPRASILTLGPQICKCYLHWALWSIMIREP